MIHAVLGFALATMQVAPELSRTCAILPSPDGETIAVVTTVGSSDVLTAKVCTSDYRCSAVASAAWTGAIAVDWASPSNLQITVFDRIATLGEDRFPSRNFRPDVEIAERPSLEGLQETGVLVQAASCRVGWPVAG